jgi:hypothetical protein
MENHCSVFNPSDRNHPTGWEDFWALPWQYPYCGCQHKVNRSFWLKNIPMAMGHDGQWVTKHQACQAYHSQNIIQIRMASNLDSLHSSSSCRFPPGSPVSSYITLTLHYKSPNIVHRANNVLVDTQLSIQYFLFYALIKENKEFPWWRN